MDANRKEWQGKVRKGRKKNEGLEKLMSERKTGKIVEQDENDESCNEQSMKTVRERKIKGQRDGGRTEVGRKEGKNGLKDGKKERAG